MMSSTRFSILTVAMLGLCSRVTARGLLDVNATAVNASAAATMNATAAICDARLGEACCEEQPWMDVVIYDVCGGGSTGLVCIDGTCQDTCGQQNMPICKDPPHHCGANLTITPDTVFGGLFMCVCGGKYETCCVESPGANGTCADGFGCDEHDQCQPCGGMWEGCCGGEDGTCRDGYSCNYGQCQPCGDMWQTCCGGVNGTCLEGHNCENSQCRPIPGFVASDPADEPEEDPVEVIDDEEVVDDTTMEEDPEEVLDETPMEDEEEVVDEDPMEDAEAPAPEEMVADVVLACGEEGHPICEHGGPSCADNLDIRDGVCVCGGAHETCCHDDRCKEGNQCSDGMCTPCGDSYQMCCQPSGRYDGCNRFHTCSSNTCQPCGDTWQAPCESCMDGLENRGGQCAPAN